MAFTPLRSERLRMRDGYAVVAQFGWDFTIPLVRPQDYAKQFEHADIAPQQILKAFTASKADILEFSMTEGYWDSDAWGQYPSGKQAFQHAPMQGTVLRAFWSNSTNKHDVNTYKKDLRSAMSILSSSLTGSFSSSLIHSWYTWEHVCDSHQRCSPMTDQMLRVSSGGYLITAIDIDEEVCASNLYALLGQLPCHHASGIGSLLDASAVTGTDYWAIRMEIESSPVQSAILLKLRIDTILPSNKFPSGAKINTVNRLAEATSCCDDSTSLVCGKDRTVRGTSQRLPPASVVSVTNSTVNIGMETQLSVARLLNLDDSEMGYTSSDGTLEQPSKSCNILAKPCVFAGTIEILVAGNKVIADCVNASRNVSDLLIPLKGFGIPQGNRMSVIHRLSSTSLDRGSFQTKVFLKGLPAKPSHECFITHKLPWQIYPSLTNAQLYLCSGNNTESCCRQPLNKDNTEFSPSQFRGQPGQLVLRLEVSSSIEMVYVLIPFKVAHSLYNDHPPDAQRGLEIPPLAVVLEGNNLAQEIIYSQALHLEPPSPDFSYTFSGITFGCCALTLLVGGLMNILGKAPSIVPT